MIVTPLSVTIVSPALLSSTLPPSALAAMSTMTEPGFMPFDRVRGDEQRRPAARDLGGRDHDVHRRDVAVQLLLLGGLLLGRELAGVAALAGRVDDGLQDEELGAEALGLLLRLGPDVVGLHDRAEPLRGADRLEPGDADPEDQDVGRLGRAGGGRQQREVAPERLGRDEDRLVAADVRLRAERVHRLGPAERPRDRVEADRGDALLRERLRPSGGR